MTNVPQTTIEYTEKLRQALQRDTTLRQLAAQATTRYAGEKARIDRGVVLALNGHVTLHADGTAHVQSGTDAEVVYTVNGHCDCPDAARAPEGRCKHRWAKCLVKRATAEVNAQQPQVPTYYASYYTADGVCFQGTARPRVGLGWIFHSAEEDFTLHCADAQNLVLGGRVDILEAQRAADGDLVRKVCTHNGARRNLKHPGGFAAPTKETTMDDDTLDALEFLLHAPPLPDGCTCTRTTTETLGLLQYVWDEACPVHRLE